MNLPERLKSWTDDLLFEIEKEENGVYLLSGYVQSDDDEEDSLFIIYSNRTGILESTCYSEEAEQIFKKFLSSSK